LHPSDQRWPVRESDSFDHIQAAVNPSHRGWRCTIEEIQTLQHIVGKACLSKIAQQSKFPDWLGYIGLVLHLSQLAERSDPLISRGLIPQFLELVLAGSEAGSVLREHLESGAALRWRELELVEQHIKAEYKRH